MSTTTIDAADVTVVHELKMSTPDMGWLSRGLLAAAATDEIYGVRCHAHIVAEGLTAVCTATDGYRLHQLHLPLHAPVHPVDVVIPHDLLVWAGKNVRTFRPKKDALIEPVAVLQLVVPAMPDEHTHPGWATVIYREWDDDTAPSARFDAPLRADAYPPTDRLIDAARVAEPGPPSAVNLDFLADARALATAITDPPTIHYTRGTDGKPGPALLDFWAGGVLFGSALIQPSKTETDE
ncbi:MAG: hypothetical protein BGN97_00390 [Microbacterium sp. 69-10]|uniref:hypothetical protein n=1 Tax=Microbacterium sp. 69-10 TaxID=1895783 RepID=UPI0009601172|nr:hypothetical protein [Microbacterium sp. 69-10]OJU39713.1 MAG: hypothetical protein BGN97_00390 [Microbacterium sp. 69-10]